MDSTAPAPSVYENHPTPTPSIYENHPQVATAVVHQEMGARPKRHTNAPHMGTRQPNRDSGNYTWGGRDLSLSRKSRNTAHSIAPTPQHAPSTIKRSPSTSALEEAAIYDVPVSDPVWAQRQRETEPEPVNTAFYFGEQGAEAWTSTPLYANNPFYDKTRLTGDQIVDIPGDLDRPESDEDSLCTVVPRQ